MQSDSKVVPVPSVMWPAGQSRQEVEAGAGWYLETGQEVQTATAHTPQLLLYTASVLHHLKPELISVIQSVCT
jgi:hypothetical protein